MMLRGHGHHREVGSVGECRPGPPARIQARAVGTGIALVVIAAGVSLGVGVTHARISGTEALYTSVAPTQTNSLTAQTCVDKDHPKPKGSHLKRCPKPAPAPSSTCKENVLDSQSPASKLTDPIDSVPVTLSAVYHDESAMDTVTNPPKLSIDGADQSGAWGTSLQPTSDTSKNNDYRTTVSYTVPASFGDGGLHTFVITFFDTDKSIGCGVATFYVQYPPAGPPPPSGSCTEDVLDSQSPDSTAAQPITDSAATLTAVYKDEKPLNTTTLPPTLSIDGVDQPNAFPNAFDPVDTTTQTDHNYVTPVSYDVPAEYVDGALHTFVITVYDGDNNGCGVATFYVKATP